MARMDKRDVLLEDEEEDEDLETARSKSVQSMLGSIESQEIRDTETIPVLRKFRSKHMKLFPELYRTDVSIHPSYTGLKVLPYHVVCRQRIQRYSRRIARQLNREVTHFAMVQMFALDGVRLDRVFSIGMSPKLLIVPDPLTEQERHRLNRLFRFRYL